MAKKLMCSAKWFSSWQLI